MSDEKKKTVLAFDTAMGGVSAGLIAANGHVVSRMVETEREQAAILVPMIQEVLEEASVDFKELDLIVSSVGPGSFTGLRIGLSTARTFGLALDIPVVGLVTLDLMAQHYETDKTLLVVLETKRQDFYARYYDSNRVPMTEAFAGDAPMVLEQGSVDEFVVGGDCLNRFQESVSDDLEVLENLTQPDPILMAQLGLEQFERDGQQGTPHPLYLRGADVSRPKVPLRKLAEG